MPKSRYIYRFSFDVWDRISVDQISIAVSSPPHTSWHFYHELCILNVIFSDYNRYTTYSRARWSFSRSSYQFFILLVSSLINMLPLIIISTNVLHPCNMMCYQSVGYYPNHLHEEEKTKQKLGKGNFDKNLFIHLNTIIYNDHNIMLFLFDFYYYCL